MSTLAISLVQACAGGDHASVRVILNPGATEKVYEVQVSDLRTALSPEHREEVLLGILKLACLGLTNAECKTKFQAGFTVTI